MRALFFFLMVEWFDVRFWWGIFISYVSYGWSRRRGVRCASLFPFSLFSFSAADCPGLFFFFQRLQFGDDGFVFSFSSSSLPKGFLGFTVFSFFSFPLMPLHCKLCGQLCTLPSVVSPRETNIISFLPPPSLVFFCFSLFPCTRKCQTSDGHVSTVVPRPFQQMQKPRPFTPYSPSSNSKPPLKP